MCVQRVLWRQGNFVSQETAKNNWTFTYEYRQLAVPNVQSWCGWKRLYIPDSLRNFHPQLRFVNFHDRSNTASLYRENKADLKVY